VRFFVRRFVDEHKPFHLRERHRPNMGECWAQARPRSILGNICTRSARFVPWPPAAPTEYDLDESCRVAEAIRLMKVKHAAHHLGEP
jgi:lipoic acid synthetase